MSTPHHPLHVSSNQLGSAMSRVGLGVLEIVRLAQALGAAPGVDVTISLTRSKGMAGAVAMLR